MKKLCTSLLLLICSIVVYSQDPQFNWANAIGSSTSDAGNDVTLDPSGNPIFVGEFTQTVDFDPSSGTSSLSSTFGTSGFVQKLNNDNTLDWVAGLRTQSGSNCYPQAVSTDNSGNIYVTGHFTGTVDFDPGAGSSILSSSADLDGFVLKLNSSGTFQWVRQIGATLDVRANSIAVDGSGSAFVVGYYEGIIDLNTDAGVNNRTASGQEDIFIIKVSSAGAHQWGYGIGGTSEDEAHAVAIDAQDDIYVAGLFRSSNVFFSTASGNSAILSSGGNQDIFAFKIDGPTAVLDWAKSTGGSSSEGVKNIAIGASDDLYLTGYFSGTADFNPSAATVNHTSAGLRDIFVLKWNLNGFYLWSKTLGGTANDTGEKITLDNSDNVYVTGDFSGTVDFDPGAGTSNLASSGGDNSYVLKLDSDGLYDWAGSLAGSSNLGQGIAADAANIYVTGLFGGTTDFDPGAGVENRSSNGAQNDIFSFKLSTNNDPTDIGLSSNSINENNAINATIGNLSTTDADVGDTHTYSLVTGSGDTDNASFNILGNALRIGTASNHEIKDSYSIRIQTTDSNGGTYSESFTVSINDVSEAPTDITATPNNIDENTTGSVTLSAMDEDAGNSHTFTLVSGTGDTNNSAFSITSSQLNLLSSVSHEKFDELSVRVRATDNPGELNVEKAITIFINDLPEAPTNISLDNSSIDENELSGTAVGALSTTDQDDGETHTYTLISGTGDTDNASFSINGTDLESAASFDFETKDSYSVRINTNDGNGGNFERAFTISINDISEAPTDVSLDNTSIDENEPTGTTVGALSTNDVDAGETYTYTLVAGSGDTDNGSFTIDGNELKSGATFDFETKDTYSVRINTNDGNGGNFDKSFSISINDTSEPPTDITLSNNSIDENEISGTSIGTLSTTDIDAGETYTYTFVSGAGDSDNASFSIDGTDLESGEVFDFESKDTYSVRINTNDGNGGNFEKAFTISVNDISETPTNISLDNSSIDENESSGTAVGSFTTTDDDAGETYTYTLVSGTGDIDNSSFSINGVGLESAASFDFETKNTYSVRINTNDGNGGNFEKAFTISVNDLSEAPTNISLDNSSIGENEPAGTVIGSFTTTDVDTGETYIYTLVSGTGDTDNASFSINGSDLESAEVFDFETKDTYSVRINTNDGNGGNFEKAFTVNINDASEIVTWNGAAWTNVTGPTNELEAVIDGNYNVNTDGNFDVNSITINAGSTFTVDGESTFTIQSDLTNNGTMVIESGSSLFTYEANTVSGNNIEFRRNTRYSGGKYSFVGSPVQQDASITGNDLGSSVFKYNETTPYGTDGINRWEDASADELIPGKGYTQAFQQEIVFTGMPNKGTIVVNGSYTEDTDDDYEGWLLVSNPYPAAIDVADFLSTNSFFIEGAVYIWDDNGSNTQRGTNSDYIVANGSMATNTTPAGGQTRYNLALGSSQGFFVKLKSSFSTNITFSEDMRISGLNADDNFFRETALPIARINLTNNDGLFKQTVVGLAEDAINNELNRTYDAQAFNSASDDGLFTMKAGRVLSLNGMTSNWEVIQLQFNAGSTGIYQISVDLEEYEQSIYLRDNFTGDVTDLRANSYTFTSESGINTARFELISSPSNILGLDDERVLIYSSNSILFIQQEGRESREYQLFNMNGQKLISTTVQSKTEVDLSAYAKGIYLVFDGQKTHKIILK